MPKIASGRSSTAKPTPMSVADPVSSSTNQGSARPDICEPSLEIVSAASRASIGRRLITLLFPRPPEGIEEGGERLRVGRAVAGRPNVFLQQTHVLLGEAHQFLLGEVNGGAREHRGIVPIGEAVSMREVSVDKAAIALQFHSP